MALLREKPSRNDGEAIRKLVQEIDSLDQVPNKIFRRIWLVVLVVFPFALVLFYFAAVRR